jgi:hypothetical protein
MMDDGGGGRGGSGGGQKRGGSSSTDGYRPILLFLKKFEGEALRCYRPSPGSYS